MDLRSSDGVLNALIGHRIEWLTSENLALPSVAAVSVWSQVGYVALFFLAGLNAVPDQLYEAARIDGASRPGCSGTSRCRCCAHDVLRAGHRGDLELPGVRHGVTP